jgi:hypothetical protein
MKPPREVHGLTDDELREARIWWQALADSTKAHASIWTILALYAQHWAKVHTVSFASDDEEAQMR